MLIARLATRRGLAGGNPAAVYVVVMRYTVTHEHLRFARQQLAQRRVARIDQLDRDKADLDRQVEAQRADLNRQASIDIQQIDAELAAIDVAEKVNEKWSSVAIGAVPDGADGRRESEPSADTTAAEEIVEAPNGDGDRGINAEIPTGERDILTQREMVLQILDRHGGSVGLFRYEIERFIQKEFGKAVPAQNISTYLHRLKTKEHLVLSHDNRWLLRGGSAR